MWDSLSLSPSRHNVSGRSVVCPEQWGSRTVGDKILYAILTVSRKSLGSGSKPSSNKFDRTPYQISSSRVSNAVPPACKTVDLPTELLKHSFEFHNFLYYGSTYSQMLYPWPTLFNSFNYQVNSVNYSNRQNLGVWVWRLRVHLNVAKLSSFEELFDSDVQKREVIPLFKKFTTLEFHTCAQTETLEKVDFCRQRLWDIFLVFHSGNICESERAK